MRKIILFLLLIVLFSNCSGSDDSMEIVVNQMEDEVEDGMEVNMGVSSFVMGDFVNGAHPTSGKATVNSDKTELSFVNFKTDNGPKLLVYLSTDISATEYVDLGDLKGVSGDFTYSIPANTDLSKYKLVNIWCVDFLVSFGTAELK
tara:strand:- start:343 stop:780 length:438 start_codon:yes stop_codon:yes gene_type:complete